LGGCFVFGINRASSPIRGLDEIIERFIPVLSIRAFAAETIVLPDRTSRFTGCLEADISA
jgi:hypothetical protein